MHTFNFSFFIIQVLEDTVRGVKGEEPGGSGLAEWLAQLQEGSTQIQKEGIRGIHLVEDFGHLIGPDLGAACICMQTVSKPEVVAEQQKEIPEETSAGGKQKTATDVVEGREHILNAVFTRVCLMAIESIYLCICTTET